MTESRKYKRLNPGLIFIILTVWGCSMSSGKPSLLQIAKYSDSPGEFYSVKEGGFISFNAMMQDLSRMDIVYIGETHTNPQHHHLQNIIIQTFHQMGFELIVGMEMFDHTYQKILDEWTTDGLDEAAFLEKTHWYANWRYDFELYRDILLFLKQNRIPILALNIPFHIPPKISIGGVHTLSEEELKHLPRRIDTTHSGHRAFVMEIFKAHRIKGRNNFEYFYLAQCVWEDAMAERIADSLKKNKMVILVGNGHIINKFGIPDRVSNRVQNSFRTVYLSNEEDDGIHSYGDYVWLGSNKKEKIKGVRRMPE